MANYFQVSPKFWMKARAGRWTDSQAHLALYLLTNEHRITEGLYRLPKEYVAHDLGWSVRKVEENLDLLRSAGFADYDETAQVVFIRKALKYHKLGGPRQVDGAVARLLDLPQSTLWQPFLEACERLSPRLSQAIAKALADPCERIDNSTSTSLSSSTSNSTSVASDETAGVGQPRSSSESVNNVIGILAQCSRLRIEPVGVENAIAAWPGTDAVQAARTVVTWATDPAFRNTNAAKLLGDALSKQKPADPAAPVTDFSKYDRAARRHTPEAAA